MRLPPIAKALVFSAAVFAILYLSLAPTSSVPAVDVWDKAQHALAFGGLTALGLAFWPGRWRAVALFAVALGLAVEVLQSAMGNGRHGDWLDLLADAVGVLAAIRLTQALRWARRRR